MTSLYKHVCLYSSNINHAVCVCLGPNKAWIHSLVIWTEMCLLCLLHIPLILCTNVVFVESSSGGPPRYPCAQLLICAVLLHLRHAIHAACHWRWDTIDVCCSAGASHMAIRRLHAVSPPNSGSNISLSTPFMMKMKMNLPADYEVCTLHSWVGGIAQMHAVYIQYVTMHVLMSGHNMQHHACMLCITRHIDACIRILVPSVHWALLLGAGIVLHSQCK